MTTVKICGLKTIAALDAARAAGADFVGLVFFEKSPRNVSIPVAAALAAHMADAAIKPELVALTVDADDAALAAIVAAVAPDWLQLHGREAPARVADIKRRFGLPILKAVPVETAPDAERAFEYAGIADLILFDAKPPKGAILPGGNGEAFDWRMLEGVKDRLPFMLSGGLTPLNVADAIAATGAGAVDVSSGIESAPGVKDLDLIRHFIGAVRAAEDDSARC